MFTLALGLSNKSSHYGLFSLKRFLKPMWWHQEASRPPEAAPVHQPAAQSRGVAAQTHLTLLGCVNNDKIITLTVLCQTDDVANMIFLSDNEALANIGFY